jgi:hypothetical protein
MTQFTDESTGFNSVNRVSMEIKKYYNYKKHQLSYQI